MTILRNIKNNTFKHEHFPSSFPANSTLVFPTKAVELYEILRYFCDKITFPF